MRRVNLMRPTNPTSASHPDLLTVEEAARVLRIGRTSAYALARRYPATDGVEGVPVLRVGHLLRVPRFRLEELVGGPITWPPLDTETEPVVSPTSLTAIDTHRANRPRRRRTAGSSQPSLPLPS
jgi:hypothetical protein